MNADRELISVLRTVTTPTDHTSALVAVAFLSMEKLVLVSTYTHA